MSRSRCSRAPASTRLQNRSTSGFVVERLSVMNRRVFLLGTGGTWLAQAAPSDQIRMGIIGPGGRGQFLMKTFADAGAVRFGAVCDVYEPNLEAGLSIAKGQAKAYRQYGALLEDKDIQA